MCGLTSASMIIFASYINSQQMWTLVGEDFHMQIDTAIHSEGTCIFP
jgi:hypothetical protein